MSTYPTDASSANWQWQYNTSVCFNDGENATLTWKVTLNSGEEIGAVSILQQAVAGGSSVEMYSTTSGKDSAFSDRVMSASYSGSSPVYNVVFTLKVNNSEDEFGTYEIRCNVNSKNYLVGQPPSDTLLKVQVPPSSVVIFPPSPTVTERDQVNLTCSADGTPPPTFTWIGPQGRTVAHRPSYTIPMVHRDMSGVYTCVATDGCGRNHTMDATLAVRYKPENTKLIPNEHIGCVRDVVSLNCSALANPNNINYTLYRNDTALASNMNGKFVISLNASGLSIFKCVPSNEVGDGENKSGLFAVKDPPRITSFTSPQIEVEGSDVTMRCIASGTAPLRVAIFHPNGSVLTNTGSYTFSPIRRRDGGTYTCTVNNGNECPAYTRTTSITVIYKPEKTSLTRLESSYCLGTSVYFNCTARGEPDDVHYSLFVNKTLLIEKSNGVFNLTLNTLGTHEYTCVPNNTAGIGQKNTFSIDMQEKIEFVNISAPMVKRGVPFTLECTTNVVRPVSITWYKNSEWFSSNRSLIFSGSLNDTGSYSCLAESACNTKQSERVNITVTYANMERYSLKCITSPAVSITIETNKTPPPDIVCMNDGKSIQSKITSTTETKVTYEVKLASLDEIEVECNAEGFPGSQHKFTVVPAGSEHTSNGSFRITNVQYPPSKQVKSNIENLVRESIDTTCLKEIFLGYGSGSVLVYVSLVLTANIADPFVLLKHALVENAPRYGIAIEPASVKIQLPESLPQLSDVMPASSSLKVTWSNATRNAQCTMRARPLAGASRDWVTSSGVSSPASLSCVLDDLEPDTLYEVEVTVSVRGDTRRDTVYIRTTPTAVEVNDQNSTIVSLAVLVAILFLVIFGLIVYIAVLKRAGLTAKRERSEADNPGYYGFQNVAMQENANQDQHVMPGMGDYEFAPLENRGQNPDPIPQYESVNNAQTQPPNRRNVTQYEDVTQRSNVPQYEDVTQEGNVTQYEAMNRHASRDQHVPANRQYDSVDSTRMSRQNPLARRARNGTGDKGEPGYENTRKRGLPHEVYQTLQATAQHSENAQYAPLHPGTRIAARPGGRDERGVATDIRGSEYQELNRAKTTDPCYQQVGSRVTSA
ncbi:hemicentin-1-like [Nematostella vectensis]|uniref:hemicentin-1-like n=1 Tax=Nematostella vectensis TaxID=45351 RepID=UPI0020771076|nr:hemicentin-1-like [Nematostella vectensis]